MSEIKEKTEGGFAHTPGPWNVATSDDGRPYIVSPGKHIIAKAYRVHVHSFDASGQPASLPGEANARLIAASPCMFEALSNLEKQVVNGRDDASLIVELGDSDLLHAISIARAALQKAVGGGHG